jgi:hypothetical protein
MRIMAIHTEVIGSLPPRKVSCPFAMNAGLPVSIDIAVALAAEPVTRRERDKRSIVKPQFIPVICIMAIETPSQVLRMVKLDLRMLFFELPPFSIYFQGGMAATAGIDSLRQRGRGNREFFLCPLCKGQKIDS